MIIVCPNCGYEIKTEGPPYNCSTCPRCSAPILGGLGVAWCG